MAAIEQFLNALKSRCGFEPADVSSGNQLRVLARVGNADNWRLIMHRLKVLELQSSWTIDISQVYFLKTKNKKAPLVKGWRIIVKADDLDKACTLLRDAVMKAPTARVTVEDEFPLPGGGIHRTYNTSRGKGAMPTSSGGGGIPSHSLFPKGG